MNKIMKLVLDIMQLGVEISKSTETDVFVSYSGHVELLSVRIFKNGWVSYCNTDYGQDIYLNTEDYRTEEDIIETLEEIYAELVNVS